MRHFLENLGFIAGAQVSVVSEISGNVIIQIKDSRVAINKEMAQSQSSRSALQRKTAEISLHQTR